MRFEREASLARRLQTPHVARVLDAGQDPPSPPYMVMEFVQGLTVAELIRRNGPFPIPEALHIVDQLLSALGSAHALGIVHRDVKPQNMMIDAERRLKVLDFGVARVAGAGTMTASGHLLGTPEYMSSEQVEGRPVDHRADLYAAGAVLYQLLSGRPPYLRFADTDLWELIRRVRTEPPPPLRQLRPETPPALVAVIERAMAKDPAQRFQSAYEMRQALAAAAGTSPARPAPTPPAATAADDTRAARRDAQTAMRCRPTSCHRGRCRPEQLPPGQAPPCQSPTRPYGPGVSPPVPRPPVTRPAGPGATRAGPLPGARHLGGLGGTVSACTVRARPVSAEAGTVRGSRRRCPPTPGARPWPRAETVWVCRPCNSPPAWGWGALVLVVVGVALGRDGAAAWAEHPDADRRCSLDANSGGHRDRSRDGAQAAPANAGSPGPRPGRPAGGPGFVAVTGGGGEADEPNHKADERAGEADQPPALAHGAADACEPALLVLLADNFERAEAWQAAADVIAPERLRLQLRSWGVRDHQDQSGAASGADGDPERPVRQHGDRD